MLVGEGGGVGSFVGKGWRRSSERRMARTWRTSASLVVELDERGGVGGEREPGRVVAKNRMSVARGDSDDGLCSCVTLARMPMGDSIWLDCHHEALSWQRRESNHFAVSGLVVVTSRIELHRRRRGIRLVLTIDEKLRTASCARDMSPPFGADI